MPLFGVLNANLSNIIPTLLHLKCQKCLKKLHKKTIIKSGLHMGSRLTLPYFNLNTESEFLGIWSKFDLRLPAQLLIPQTKLTFSSLLTPNYLPENSASGHHGLEFNGSSKSYRIARICQKTMTVQYSNGHNQRTQISLVLKYFQYLAVCISDHYCKCKFEAVGI